MCDPICPIHWTLTHFYHRTMYWTRRNVYGKAALKRSGRNKNDDAWLKALGKRIEHLIKEKGYESEYDFWVQKAGDDISRAGLNYIITGRTDPKASTLRAVAKLLNVKLKDLVDLD